jgi:hypothetical protein
VPIPGRKITEHADRVGVFRLHTHLLKGNGLIALHARELSWKGQTTFVVSVILLVTMRTVERDVTQLKAIALDVKRSAALRTDGLRKVEQKIIAMLAVHGRILTR